MKEKQKKDDFESRYRILVSWMQLRDRNRTLDRYFEDNNYKKVAIYGIGILGELFLEEAKRMNLGIDYAIDRCAGERTFGNIPIRTMDEERFEDVDVIVVTPIQIFESIEQDLSKKTEADIVSLEDIVLYVAEEAEC